MSSSELWAEVARELAPPLAGAAVPQSPLQMRRRRGFDAARDDGREAVRLVRDDGVLRWVYEPPLAQQNRRRAWRSVGVDDRGLVQRLEYPPLGRNQITEALQALDLRLNPERGLRRWRGAQGWQPLADGELAGLKGRVLLLVHGTFSKGGMYSSELAATAPGQKLFDRLTTAGTPYAAVLNFEHATLSVAPWLNALALKDALAPLPDGTTLDVLCHSRGGLVASWALKMAPALPVAQLIVVGSPLMGTSLAAPNRLREALDLLANLADAMARGLLDRAATLGPAWPLAVGGAGLAKALGGVLHLGASVPLADAVVGLVPGLMAQSRVQNNLELAQLFPLPGSARLAGIGGTFKPDESKAEWRFWNRFSNLKGQAMFHGADLIFQQPNDLVVDTVSMNQLGHDAQGRPVLMRDWESLGESDTHHCNYFRDPRVLRFLGQRLS